mgnify:CR=1 FL=1
MPHPSLEHAVTEAELDLMVSIGTSKYPAAKRELDLAVRAWEAAEWQEKNLSAVENGSPVGKGKGFIATEP